MLSAPWEQNVIECEVCHTAAEQLAGGFVKPEVLPGEDPTQSRFLVSSGDSGGMTLHPRQHLGGDIEDEMISFKELDQNGCADRADYRVGARVRRIGSGIDNLRQPVRVGQRLGIDGWIGGADRGDRSPEIV